MQESQDKSKHNETNKKVAELKTVRDESTTKKDNVESAMMCWESTESLAEKEHPEEPEKMAIKLVETMEKQKHEEEHVEPTLNTGNRLKISIKEFSWEREDDGSTLGTEEPEQQEVVYITNLEDGLRKDGTTMYDEEGPNKKSLLRETCLLKCPHKIILIMFLIFMENLIVTSTTLKISRREKTKGTPKNTTMLTWIWKRKESKPTQKN